MCGRHHRMCHQYLANSELSSLPDQKQRLSLEQCPVGQYGLMAGYGLRALLSPLAASNHHARSASSDDFAGNSEGGVRFREIPSTQRAQAPSTDATWSTASAFIPPLAKLSVIAAERLKLWACFRTV